MTNEQHSAFEVAYVDTENVRCDGDTAGHPVIYLRVPAGGMVVCPYCSKRFLRTDKHWE